MFESLMNSIQLGIIIIVRTVLIQSDNLCLLMYLVYVTVIIDVFGFTFVILVDGSVFYHLFCCCFISFLGFFWILFLFIFTLSTLEVIYYFYSVRN